MPEDTPDGTPAASPPPVASAPVIPPRARWSDEQVELVIGALLRWGVILAATVAAAGAVLYVARYGATAVDYSSFRGTAGDLRSIAGVLAGLRARRPEALVQLGLLLLLATPVARVGLSLAAFLLQRDRTYVVITSIVLVVLLYSLAFGG